MTAKASSLIGSPISPVVSGESGNSPPAEKRNNLPWARVVKGEAEEAMSLPLPHPDTPKDQPVSSDSSFPSNGNAGSPKKPPAWNKQYFNGAVAPPPVIVGATSWPALSESARSVSKSMLDSSKTVENQPIPTSKEPATSHVPRKQVNTSRSFNSGSTNKSTDNRQRPSRHGVNHGVRNANNGFDFQRPPPPPLPLPQSPSQQLSYFGVPYPRPPFGFPMVDNNWDGGRPVGGVAPKPHALVDQSSQRNSSRKGNFGSQPRGDASNIDSNQVRNDPDRNRAATQGSNFRDTHGSRQAVPFRGFMRPPPPPPMSALPFPQPLSPYGTPLGFPSPILYYPPVDHYIYTPFIGHAPPPFPSQMQMYITPSVDPSLKASLVSQINYYFSNANLDNDKYLKSYMDDQGWVPITLIAGFPKVKALTQDINVVLNSLSESTVVEIQGDKIRRRDEWMNWISHLGEVNSETGSDSKPPALSVDNTITSSDLKD